MAFFGKKKEVVKEETQAQKKEPMKDASGIILGAHTSEKSGLGIQEGTYVFEVFSDANKFQIREAVNRMYGVRAESVRIINVRPRKVRVGKFQGQKPGYKKAIVQLKKGQKIDSLSS